MLQHHHPAGRAPCRVVILGAKGFIAAALAGNLREHGIVVEALASSELDLAGATSAGQLRGLLRPEDALVFAAALTPEHGRDEATSLTNICMAEHVCAALGTAPVAHVLYISSDAVFADRESLIREDTPRDGAGAYGKMHAARERMLEDASARHGFPLCILRPVAVFGAGDTHNSYGPNRFLRFAVRDRVITLFGQGEEIREHIAIGDLVRLMLLCLERRTSGALNAASGEPVSFAELARRIIRHCPHPVEVRHEPRAPGVAVAHRRFDTSLLRREFAEFRCTPLDDALDAMHRELTASARA